MWWPVVVFILLCYYYFFVSSSLDKVKKPKIPEPVARPFGHRIEFDAGRVSLSTSRGKNWSFELDDSFYFHKGRIHTKDECFGKPSGTLIRAQGKPLYDYIQKELPDTNQTGQFEINVKEAMQHGHIFYFKCNDDRISSLSACPPGQIFDGSCKSVHPCLNQPDGTLVADAFDKQYYYLCPKGRHKCPPGTFFMLDSCRSKSSLLHACRKDTRFAFAINKSSFVSCRKGIPKVVKCPPGHVVFEDKCVPDACLHQPDGTKIPFPKENLGPFRFSTGYFVCKNNRIDETIECPSEWDKYESKGDDVIFLPQVFHNGKCSIPEFCTSVTSNDPDTVVSAYDFRKNVKNWKHSVSFDRALGFKCHQQQKVDVFAPPGQHIFDFKLTSACDAPGKRVVIGNRSDAYYDCDQKGIVPCPPDTFFDGKSCRPYIPNAHRYKNVDMFKLTDLEFDWMEPWSYSNEPSVEPTCLAPESAYVPGYNVCADPECVKYPFLKQLKAHIQLDSQNKCTFQNGKISKVKTGRKKFFNFWTQRKSIRDDECIPGSKIKSGHFLMDSVLYATCDPKQPFVFCPSSETSHVSSIDDSYACVPRDGVFEGILEADTSKTFLENHLDRVIASPGSVLKINGTTRPFDPNGIEIDSNPVEIWSDKEVRLKFKMLVNYPPHTYYENKHLKAFRNTNRVFVTRYASGSTLQPIDFPTYDIRESVAGFKSDAS